MPQSGFVHKKLSVMQASKAKHAWRGQPAARSGWDARYGIIPGEQKATGSLYNIQILFSLRPAPSHYRGAAQFLYIYLFLLNKA